MKYNLMIFTFFLSACSHELPDASRWVFSDHSSTIKVLSWDLCKSLNKSNYKRHWLSFISPHEKRYTPASVSYNGGIKIGNKFFNDASFNGYPVAAYSYNSQSYLIVLVANYEPHHFKAYPRIYAVERKGGVDNLTIDSTTRNKSLKKIAFKSAVANSLILSLRLQRIHANIIKKILKAKYSSAKIELEKYVAEIEMHIEQSPHLFFINTYDFKEQIINIPAGSSFNPQAFYISSIFYENKPALYDEKVNKDWWEIDNYWRELLKNCPESKSLFIRLETCVKKLIVYSKNNEIANDGEIISSLTELLAKFERLLKEE